MGSPKQDEARRLNGRKSRGPKTIEGKMRSRFNALKHGLTARTPVLPDEDGAAYRERLDAWTADLQPRNHIELSLVGQAVQATWQIERAERAEVARLAHNMRHAADEEEQQQEAEVNALGIRLFHDRWPGGIAAYPHPSRDLARPVSLIDPNDETGGPAGIVLRLESTAAGCRWLYDRFAELRAVLEKGQSWGSPDKLKAVRLLGRQPLEAAPDPEVAAIFLACHVIEPIFEDPFQELMYELDDTQKKSYRRWLNSRQAAALRPADKATAREVLLATVRRATSRLDGLFVMHQRRAEADRAEQADRLSFDTSPEGERLRRHVLSTGRALYRALDTFLKIRKSLDIDPDAPHLGVDGLAPETAVEGIDGPGISFSQNEPEPLAAHCARSDPSARSVSSVECARAPVEAASGGSAAVAQPPSLETPDLQNEPEPVGVSAAPAAAPAAAVALPQADSAAGAPSAIAHRPSLESADLQNEPESALAPASEALREHTELEGHHVARPEFRRAVIEWEPPYFEIPSELLELARGHMDRHKSRRVGIERKCDDHEVQPRKLSSGNRAEPRSPAIRERPGSAGRRSAVGALPP
jgi:hypothetical protein